MGDAHQAGRPTEAAARGSERGSTSELEAAMGLARSTKLDLRRQPLSLRIKPKAAPEPQQQLVPVSSDARCTTAIAPRLTKADYHSIPSTAELKSMDSKQLSAVVNFRMVRPGIASIRWVGTTDLRGINLDAVVRIERDTRGTHRRCATPCSVRASYVWPQAWHVSA